MCPLVYQGEDVLRRGFGDLPEGFVGRRRDKLKLDDGWKAQNEPFAPGKGGREWYVSDDVAREDVITEV